MPASPTPSQRADRRRAAPWPAGPRRGRPRVTCGPVSRDASPSTIRRRSVGHRRVGRDQLAGVADQGVARGVLLPAATVAALAAVPVGDDLHVAELAGHPVRAAEDPVVDDQRAADAGAERDAQDEAVAARRRRTGTRRAPRCSRRCPPRRAARTRLASARRAAARRASSRCGENITRSRDRRPRTRRHRCPRRPRRTPRLKRVDQVDDGVLDRLAVAARGEPALARQHACPWSRRHRPEPWCRRCRSRRSAAPSGLDVCAGPLVGSPLHEV